MASENDIPEREQRVANLLRTAAQSERAPESLHTRIAAMKDESAGAPRRRLLPRPAFNFVRIAIPAAAAAAGAAVLVLALGGGAGAPSIAQAAALATRTPSAPAPVADPSDPAKLLTTKVGKLHFPNWQAAGGWRAVGQRQDRLGNRTVTTVYYATGSSRVAYSIVSSPTLRLKHGMVMQSRPPQYQYSTTVSQDGRTTVVWVESGHTCLLTGPRGMSAARLRQLAFFGFRRPLQG